jgi:cellulose synthase/poly-beta-1,6-N-acetylglucosamine synthase-like glycosyltransferase
MQVGPVLLQIRSGLMNALQVLEMQSLAFVTAGSAGMGDPILCNGANLAYYKEDYLAFNKVHKRVSESGDDLFFLHWLKQQKDSRIHYRADLDSAVRTEAPSGLKSFFRQRIRWASKTLLLPDLHFLFTAFIVFGMNLLIFSLLFALILQWIIPGIPGVLQAEVLLTLLSLFTMRTLIDLLVLSPVLKLFHLKSYSRYILPAEFLYFAYVSLVGTMSQLLNVSWKGRKL